MFIRDPASLPTWVTRDCAVWLISLRRLVHAGDSRSSRSSRTGARPPMHHNADYDELIFYVRGPGAYGAITQPGTLAGTPKSIGHWGPTEDVPEGYFAWLLESGGTFRLTPAGLAAARPMETGQFGYQSHLDGQATPAPAQTARTAT